MSSFFCIFSAWTGFKKKCLPPHSVIKRRFEVTLQERLDQNYPTEKTPLDELHAQATEDFIREYLRIQPVSAEDYNARRTHPSRGWYAIAKYNHTRRWRILLEKLNLPIYNNPRHAAQRPAIESAGYIGL